MAKLIPTAKKFDSPETIPELLELLRQSADGRFMVSGGTSLAFSKPKAEHILDLSRLPLKGCTKDTDGNLKIGALTTIGDLEKNADAASFCGGVLCQATDKLASTPLRNLITVGGNLAAGYAWSDLPVALLALDATVEVLPGETVKSIPVDGQTSFRRLAASNEMISSVILNGAYARGSGAFIKISRTSSDLALVSAAVTMQIRDGKMKSVRVVAGGLVPTALRLTDVESVLEGQAPCERLFEEAASKANVTPRPDTRADADYRLDVLKTIIARACTAAVKE